MHVYTGIMQSWLLSLGPVNEAWSRLDLYQINQGKPKQALSWGRDSSSHDSSSPTPRAGGGRVFFLPLKVANCWLQFSSSWATHSPTPNSLSLLKAQLSSAKIFWAIIFNICPISILEYSYTSIISLWQEQGAFALWWQIHTEGRDMMTCTQEDLQLFFPYCKTCHL